MELKVTQLKKSYANKTVLDIPSLTIHSGELVGLVGNNGAGKTTLLRLLLDLIKPDEGVVESNHLAVNKDEQWKTYTGSFIDGRFLIDFLTPEEYFLFIAKAYNISKEKLQQRLNTFSSFTHGEILGTKKYLRNFSEGNRQKIGIIGAMIVQPKVLLLDEPFNYLDPSSQMIIARLIQQMNQTLGTTIILSSHNLSVITDIATRVVLLEKGKVTYDLVNDNGSSLSVLENYFSTERQFHLRFLYKQKDMKFALQAEKKQYEYLTLSPNSLNFAHAKSIIF